MRLLDLERTEEERNKDHMLVLAIVLVLLLLAMCYVVFLLTQNGVPSTTALPPQQPLVQKSTKQGLLRYTPLTAKATVVVKVKPTKAPTLTPKPQNKWEFLNIDSMDIGTFKNTNTGLILKGQCKDPNLPVPEIGTLYLLNDSVFITTEDKLVQRFELIK